MKVLPKETASMLTRDGVRLDADIYRPDAEGEFPVLLMRQPYGRAIASTVVYAHPIWYAANGYIVVIQDVRGRGTSAGKFQLFAHEIEDGIDTINWAAKLPGSTGEVGMYGFSYQGMTQLYAASDKPAALKTICPAMIGSDLYADWAYEGGAFCLQANLGWAIQLATETARLQGDEQAYQELYQASRNLPLYDEIPTSPKVINKYAPDSFYHKWIENFQPGEYWQNLSPNMENVDIPMLHIGGWFDTYLRGTINFYQEMASRSKLPQKLVVGPWSHIPWGRKVGAVNYGLAASNPIDDLQILWFDQFLKGLNKGILERSPVSLFEMGSNKWRDFNFWPSNNYQFYYLASKGLANIREDSGSLIESCPDICTDDIFVHDPWRPVPSLGGHGTFPAGSFERSSLDSRTDVLTYTSAVLTENLHIAGNINIELYCTVDASTFDISAVLSEVKPDGSVYNFTQGYIRVNSDDLPVKIALQPTCIKISPGNALRLSLSAASFPAYPVNPGTNKPLKETKLIDSKIMTITVKSGGDNPSQISLPLAHK
ncbi:MAG: CocE/NonD family hydrolase [Microcoleaceae cyanobacterium MO_207.B10]|nr:CocE/NonD family hydrolase [Microcoleaceae cyanobacterium MO_207.B10]